VEKVEITLPEDLGQVLEKFKIDGLNLGFTSLQSNLVRQLIDISTDLVSISPLTEVKSKLELIFSHFEHKSQLLLVFKFDGVWNFGVLLLMHDLLEVRVKCSGDTSVLALALVFKAEGEDLSGRFIIKLKQETVLSQGIHNDFANI